METEEPKLLIFSVPELDAEEVDNFLEDFKRHRFVDVLKSNYEIEVVKENQRLVVPATKFWVLVHGSWQEAEDLAKLLIRLPGPLGSEDWPVRFGDPNKDLHLEGDSWQQGSV